LVDDGEVSEASAYSGVGIDIVGLQQPLVRSA